jgi:hypothetical protein
MLWPYFGSDMTSLPRQQFRVVRNLNLGKFCRVLQWKMLVYFMDIWCILWQFGIFYGHLVYSAVIWYIFPVLVF